MILANAMQFPEVKSNIAFVLDLVDYLSATTGWISNQDVNRTKNPVFT